MTVKTVVGEDGFRRTVNGRRILSHKDWGKIRAMYDRGDHIDEIAEKFKIHPGTIKNKAWRDKWGKRGKRLETYYRKAAKRAIRKAADRWYENDAEEAAKQQLNILKQAIARNLRISQWLDQVIAQKMAEAKDGKVPSMGNIPYLDVQVNMVRRDQLSDWRNIKRMDDPENREDETPLPLDLGGDEMAKSLGVTPDHPYYKDIMALIAKGLKAKSQELRKELEAKHNGLPFESDQKESSDAQENSEAQGN